MEEIRDQKNNNPKNLNLITIKVNNYIEFVCYDKEGYKISYNHLARKYIKELY